MKKKSLVMTVAVILVLAIVAGIFLVSQTYFSNTNSSLIRECPDTWVEDRMPSDKPHTIYLTFSGVSKDSKAYDVDWIENNCSSTQFNISN